LDKVNSAMEIILTSIRDGKMIDVEYACDMVDRLEAEALKRNWIKDTKSEYDKILSERKV